MRNVTSIVTDWDSQIETIMSENKSALVSKWNECERKKKRDKLYDEGSSVTNNTQSLKRYVRFIYWTVFRLALALPSSLSLSLSMLLCCFFVCCVVLSWLAETVCERTIRHSADFLFSVAYFSIIHSFRILKWLMNAARATIMRQFRQK